MRHLTTEPARHTGVGLDTIDERCCGIDVHQRVAVAGVITPGPGGAPRQQVRTFSPLTEDLLALGDWLAAQGVRPVAMESTGVYWKPLWNLLEGRVTRLLVNAQRVTQVPGRTTGVKEGEWLADLLRHGLLRASFVPQRPQRDLRALTRYRTALVRERAAAVNRLQKALEGANRQLGDVASSVLGGAGRQMLRALVAGTTDPAALAELARGRLREKRADLEERALAGRMGPHQRFRLAEQRCQLGALEEGSERVSAEIAARLRPLAAAVEPPDSIPGVGRRAAETLVAGSGPDRRRFPSAAHLASWAGLCPGHHQSAGKQTSGETRAGPRWLRAALTEAAQAAARTTGTSLAAQYRRLAARRGEQEAAVAVGPPILVIAYHLLARATTYEDLGGHYCAEHDRQLVQRRLVHRLEGLGYRVTLEPLSPRAPAA